MVVVHVFGGFGLLSWCCWLLSWCCHSPVGSSLVGFGCWLASRGWRLQLFGCFLRLSAGLAVVVHHFCGVFFWVFCCARGLVVAQVVFTDNSHMWLLVLVSFWGVFVVLVGCFAVTVSAGSAQL